MSGKHDLLNDAAFQYRAFHEAMHGLNEEHLTEVWLGTWSIRDIIAHISGWQREMIPALERLAQGQKPIPAGVSYDNVDAWNEKFAAAKRDVEVTEVLLELDRSHELFMHAAAQVPDDRYVPERTAWKIVEMNSAHHYKEHGEEIRAWRESRGL
jgi:hypothetical protein